MANLTITVDDDVLKKARIRALEQNTSVNALLRDYLADFARTRSTQEEAVRALLAIAARSNAGSGGRQWTRDELHDR